MITREEALRRRLAQLEAMDVTPVYDEAGRMIDLRMDEGDMPDNLAASATPIAVDPDVKITSLGRRVVGPRTATGNAPVPGEYFQSEDEAEAYYNRGIDPKTGDVIASGADEGMLERGFRPVSKADGTVGYAVASGTEGMSTGNAGSAPVNRAYQEQLMQPDRAKGFPQGRFRQDTLPGPLGASTEVMVPTDETRQYNAGMQERQSVDRFVGRTGMDRELAADMTREQRRDYLSGKREQDLYARRQRMKEENIYARGSHNINAGNEKAIRQLARLQREDPKAHDQLLADNMGPRNVVQRYNPRTGQWEFSSERAYPPAERGADGRMMEMMMRRQMMEDMQRREGEQALVPLRAEAQRLATPAWGAPGLPRDAARQRLIASGKYTPEQIDQVLGEVYPAGNEGPQGMGPEAWGGAPPQGGM